MRVIKASYFDKFNCLGSECEDNCCRNWSIDIDSNTYEKYQALCSNEFNDRLKDSLIKSEENVTFNIVNGKCPFLNNNNLCDVYINLGEEFMGKTCKLYPRNFNLIDNTLYKSLALSCIEVARLVLLNKNGIDFIVHEEVIDLDNLNINKSLNTKDTNNILEKYFYELNTFSINIIKNRKFSIEDRLIILGLFFEEISEKMENENIINKTISKFENNLSSYIDKNYYCDKKESLCSKEFLCSYELTEIKMNLVSDILSFIMNTRVIINKNFSKYIDNVNSVFDVKDDFLEYKKAYKYYENFMKDREYILENYLVNYMFSNNFSYSKYSVIDSYTKLVIHFVVVRFLIVANIYYYKENFTEDELVKIIQSYSMISLHDISLNDDLENYLELNGINSIESMIDML